MRILRGPKPHRLVEFPRPQVIGRNFQVKCYRAAIPQLATGHEVEKKLAGIASSTVGGIHVQFIDGADLSTQFVRPKRS
jgi:hypothetical protein